MEVLTIKVRVENDTVDDQKAVYLASASARDDAPSLSHVSTVIQPSSISDTSGFQRQ